MRRYLLNMLEQTNTLNLESMLLHVSVAVIMGFIIYLSYWITHAGTVYSKKFNVSLIMLTILTTTVMAVIGNNVALSLGMVGALSIVRFRTAIKDSRDAAYIFWTIIAGICSGTGDYLLGALGSAAIFVILLFLGRIKNDSRKLLIIRGSRNVERRIETIVFDCFMTKVNMRVKNTTKDTVEYIYELSSKQLEDATKRGKLITEMLYEMKEIEYVNLVTQNDEISG